ncbi:(E3-independent) E2 ubiquitin-conjugating enzyme UBE2O [Musca autumnalis]|uniref:(E3-independent) E2 ubiquitin-conjugating enzyme UBE2O n=1 Tax=Musca autumnalis TaxID=221902 RepID=UPI003CEC919D
MESEVTSTDDVKKDSGVAPNNGDVNQHHTEQLENPNPIQNDSSSFEQTESINKSGASPKLQTEENKNVKNLLNGNEAPGECMYFFEDEVFRIDKKGRVKFGVITETQVDQDEDFEDLLAKGEVRVAWYPRGSYEVNSESSIGLVDRTLMPGDVVRRLVRGKETQRGYCRDINMKADVRVLGTKYVITNVNAERVKPLCPWPIDSAVYLNSWVGSIKDVDRKAILRTMNGCRIEISSKHLYLFEDMGRSGESFYPGCTITGYIPPLEEIKILTPEIPLTKYKKRKLHSKKFIVERVYTESVWVHWQCKALSDETSLQAITLQPHPCVTGEDLLKLKLLNLFEACTLQIGDESYLTYSSCDTIMKKSDWENEMSTKFKIIFEKQKQENLSVLLNPPTNNGSGPGVEGTGGGGGTMHQHSDKLKKKQSLSLDEKSMHKFKRGLFKGNDKLGNNYNKDSGGNKKQSTPPSPTEKKDDSEWLSIDEGDEDDEDDFDVEESLKLHNANDDAISTTTTISTGSSPSRTSPINLTKRQLKKAKNKKTLKKPLLSELKKEFTPKEGCELATEALLVYSTATVVWQDGTVECDIPSTELYPIHHVDNHEFFPGDFVISGIEDAEVNYRDYGVIQTVDHEGRIAHVKWFTTYTSADEPKPAFKGESEVSVYDLKDHPDFQYRPGTMVIRVANFVGDDAKCTAGQIIDNFIDGRVKVWWVDGHISMCWPQDLFEVGQYDNGDWGQGSEDSWETESENSEFGAAGNSSSLKLSMSQSHVLSNIEKAQQAVSRLEEIFNISPNLQNPEVMRKLLAVYKGCRYLDRLLNTDFFHEDNFLGLIERVRRGGNHVDRVQEQNRLFNDGGGNTAASLSPSPNQHHPQQHFQYYSAIVAVNNGQKPSVQSTEHVQSFPGLPSKEYAPKVLFNISSTPFKCCTSSQMANSPSQLSNPSNNIRRRYTPATGSLQPTPQKRRENVPTTDKRDCDHQNVVAQSETVNVTIASEISPHKNKQINAEKHQLLNSAMLNIEKAYEKTSQLKSVSGASGGGSSNMNNASMSQDDSGNYSRNENCDGSSTSCTSSSDLTNIDTNNSITKVNDNQKSVSCSSIELPEDVAPELVCVRLCSLLKEQLVKCLDEIREKYYKDDQLNLSEIFDVDDETLETVIDFESTQEDGNSEIKNKKDVEQNKNDDEKDDDVDMKLQLPVSDNGAKSNEPSSLVTSSPTATDDNNKAMEAGLQVLNSSSECFQLLPSAPKTHKYHSTLFHPNNTQQYYKAVQKEHRMLKSSLPSGVWVRIFEDRMDLLSVMIEGPKKTPYEDGMFFFDMQLGRDYPKSPPLCHYISYCSDRLNPNLYEDGKVCVSLLGTWTGNDSEMWGPKSTLLQVIVSIQGLILVPEPYYNEAGYDKQKDTQQGRENSRMYNEMVMIKMVQATTKLIQNPPEIFRNEVLTHYKRNGMKMYERIRGWMELSKDSNKKSLENNETDEVNLSSSLNMPDFPLVPASRGFCLTLAGLLETFKKKLSSCIDDAIIIESPKVNE